MLGAPLGGTIRGGHQVLDPSRVSLITPPNFGSGAGIWFPLIVVVAPGSPSTPLICWAAAGPAASATTQMTKAKQLLNAALIDGTIPSSSDQRLSITLQWYDAGFDVRSCSPAFKVDTVNRESMIRLSPSSQANPTNPGVSMKPIFECRAVGVISTGPSIPPVPPSTSCSRRCAMPRRPSACSARRLAIHRIRSPGSSTPLWGSRGLACNNTQRYD